MFCRKCGNKLMEGDAFCTNCGEPIELNSLENGLAQNNKDLEVQNENNQLNINQTIDKQVQKNKKGIKKLLVIIGVVIIMTVSSVVTVKILKQPGNLLSPQRKVVDKYFDAINEVDIEKIYEIKYTDEALELFSPNYTEIDELSFLEYKLGFARGSLYDKPEVMKESYPNESDGLSQEEIVEATCDMLSVSYDVIDIKPLSDIELTYSDQSGNNVVVDRELVEKRANITNMSTREFSDVEVGDIYVAQLHIEWKYDNMLYGYDKSWWNDEEFDRWVKDGRFPETYKEAINEAKNRVYTLIIYECDEEWYVLDALSLNDCCWRYSQN